MKTNEYNQCVDLYADGLFRFACRMLSNRMDAEDAVQLVFERFWTKHESVAFEKAKSYLFTSVYRACIDWKRKTSRESGNEPEEWHGGHAQPQTNFEFRDAIQEALKKLPEIQRTLVLLRDYEGYAYDEMAEIVGLSISQVKVYIFRARKKLQVYLAHLKT
jgi:RNA polymerase sigma-70 factor (ECF subfamily)